MTITLTGRIIRHKGGEGSGFHGHSGRPGEVGGSAAASIDIKSLKFDLSKISSPNKVVDSIKEFGAYWILADSTVIKASGGHLDAAWDLIRSAGAEPRDLEFAETHNTTNTFEYNIMFDKGAIRVEHYNRDLQIETNAINTATLRKLKKLINGGIIQYDAQANVVWSAGYEQIQSFSMKDLIEANEVTTEIMHNYRSVDIRDLSKKIDRPRPVYVLKQALTGRIINKGGEGSGNFNHAGRPGKIGGSADKHAALHQEIINFQNEFNKLDTVYHKEFAEVIAPDGNVLYKASGSENKCELPVTGNDADATLIHNHPPCELVMTKDPNGSLLILPGTIHDISQPPSPADVLVAVQRNMYQVIATGYSRGTRVKYTITRPIDGWPDIKDLNDAIEGELQYQRMFGSNRGMQPDEYSAYVLDKMWQSMNDGFGIRYKYETYNS